MRGFTSPCGDMIRRAGRHALSDMLPRWEPGFGGVDSPYDLGWVHACEIGGPDFPRTGCVMTKDQYAEYCAGFWAGKRDRR
jgi:hypothetical protein